MDAAVSAFQDQIRQAAAAGGVLRIRGGGTKDWYGGAIASTTSGTTSGAILDTRPYAGVVDYEPTELVITARCGTPLAAIEALLAEHGQMLAFEPPHFGPGATIGGAIAGGLSGLRRANGGAVRDFLLGALLMDGRGDVLRFGGQVMKNVAGYDVSRLLAGSLGTLGLLLEVSVKVLPRPVREATLRFACDEVEAIRRLNAWAGQPLPLSASCWAGGVLMLRLSGAGAAVDAAVRTLGGDAVPDGARFWDDVREQRHAFFDGDMPVWRLALPSTTAPMALGPTAIEWGGGQRWLRAPGDDANTRRIREAATAAGGHATLFRGGGKTAGVFQPLAPAIARIHARLKAGFDPSGVFDPGRLV
jgi:glycolate oxidase FAD binding subunit